MSPFYLCMGDDFDKLATGKNFNTRTKGALIDGAWVQAKLSFDNRRLEYYVELSWGGDRVSDTFGDPESATERFEELCEKHDLSKC